MGWASGSRLCSEVIDIVRRHVPEWWMRVRIYKELIVAFEGEDCDTLFECLDKDSAFAEAWTMHESGKEDS
jgi:hypothetical protein